MEQTRRSLFRLLLGAPLAITAGPAVAKMLPDALPHMPSAPLEDQSVVALVEKRMNDAYLELQRQLEADISLNGPMIGGAVHNGCDFCSSPPVMYTTYGNVPRNVPLGKELHA